MPTEFDDSKPKIQTQPLVDFYDFNQGSATASDTTISGNTVNPGGKLELPNPYSYHQGISSLAKAIGDTAASRVSDETKPASKDQSIPEVKVGEPASADKLAPTTIRRRPSPFASPKDDNASVPKPAIPVLAPEIAPKPPEVTPKPVLPPEITPKPVLPPEVRPNPVLPAEIAPKPSDKLADNPVPLPAKEPSKSAIVEAYERKQGARQAGAGAMPAIDPIPNDVTPPTPRPVPRPDIAPWTPPKPEIDPRVKPEDQRPDRDKLISRLEPKYETHDVAKAVQLAKDTGLPLAVHIGAPDCIWCVRMEENVWPGVEGTRNQKGSMQGKVVVLHINTYDVPKLQGESRSRADEITKDLGGGIPVLRVFKVDESGKITKTAQNDGAIMKKTDLENFLIEGGARR